MASSNIPKASDFPNAFDDDKNLFLVHDALRVRLLEDYMPGDASVIVEGEESVMSRFPPNGIITLTEQCEDIDKRALSFYYNSKTSTSFDELEILEDFKDLDVAKPKKVTNVTMNVVDRHHNHLKDALISTQYFLGTRYDSEDEETMTGRIKYVERLALSPKVWFSSDSTVGIAPLRVVFSNESFRLGDGKITMTWNFGEGPPLVREYDGSADFMSRNEVVGGISISGGSLTKTYSSPGIYTVRLTVENEHGQDSVEFINMINARIECPDPAVIQINHKASQNYYQGNSSQGIFPRIRSVTNSFVELEVPSGPDPSNPGYRYSGEKIDGNGSPIDPIEEYTWSLSDDLPHSDYRATRASYSLGGYYDIDLRVDTLYGAYRITKYPNSIDIVESSNLWMFNHTSLNTNGSGVIKAYEFGLNSETFKTLGSQTLQVDRDNSFLDHYGSQSYYFDALSRSKREFGRNVEFVPAGTGSSGGGGNSLLMWAGGGAVVDGKKIQIRKYNAFDDHYESVTEISNRPWNWAALNSADKTYFLFGEDQSPSSGMNIAFPKRLDYDLATQTAMSPTDLQFSSFENGADELLRHPSFFNESGTATNGNFAVYRTAWKDAAGYILRNSSVNEFFRLSDFYRTNGTLSNPFGTITKLPSIVGSVKLEGQLVNLSNGIFLFNNSGEICAWNDTSLTWEVGRSNSSSVSFRSLQDLSVSGFDDRSNTLLAASDGDRIVYLSYDYSTKAFIKFDGTDLTFSVVKTRPSGSQFKMGIY
jgi:PKD repeat protein